jgi:hypothetical protein
MQYFAVSFCFYVYCCFLVAILTAFQLKWASAQLLASEYSVFAVSLVALIFHWRHMAFKDRQAFRMSELNRQTVKQINREVQMRKEDEELIRQATMKKQQ